MSSPQTPKRHENFYFEDGDTTNGTLFRLHKFILKRHSTFFRDMFEHSPPDKDEHGNTILVDGSSDEKPIQLGGHALATLYDIELESICKVLYDMPGIPLSELSVNDAVPLLQVATKFQFDKIHQKTIERLENAPLPVWQRFVLAKDCLIDHWTLPACISICSLVDYPPTPDAFLEFSRHNVMLFWKLLEIRESHRRQLLTYTYGDWYCPYWDTSVEVKSHGSPACNSCRQRLKVFLKDILEGRIAGDSNAGVAPTFEDLLLPVASSLICAGCIVRKDDVISQVLAREDLEKRVKAALSHS
ncbi:hypothetical protein RhiJN_23797 [Ceratobasidium sp. AG-Ba]|nr:hypothetical protein RhiJN_23797 [Ceratobasidium sp. AG-Ba]